VVIREPFVLNLGKPVVCYVLGQPGDRLPESQHELGQLIQALILPAVEEADNGGLQSIGEPGHFVAILWLDGDQPAVDLWCFTGTEISNNPGVNFTYCNEDGFEPSATVTCGNSLVILGMEELHRRACGGPFNEYINGPRPTLPDFLVGWK